MDQTNNIFISWSKERGKAAAIALREWLPLVVPAARPWMSDKDIDKGTVWLDELAGALGTLKQGIVCVTNESLSEPWLLYEAGVLSKALDRKTRVWTYLVGGLRPGDVPQPLGLFQATVAEKADTWKLIQSVNESMGDFAASREVLKKQFDMWWPELNGKIDAIPAGPPAAAPPRRMEDMIAEVLAQSRETAKVTSAVTAMSQELYLVGSAIEELSEAVGQTLPATTLVPTISGNVFTGYRLGLKRFLGTATHVPLSTLGGQQTVAPANAVRAGSGTEGTPLGPMKNDGAEKSESEQAIEGKNGDDNKK
jgi:hypothetical protein